MMIRSGSPIRVRHSVSICCSPPDSTPASVCWRSLRRGNIWYMSSKHQRAALAAALLAQHQVLVHRQVREDVAVFGHVADAQVRDFVGFLAQESPALSTDGPLPSTRPMMALAVVERPEPLRPSSATISPASTSNHTMQHMALAIEGMEVVNFNMVSVLPVY